MIYLAPFFHQFFQQHNYLDPNNFLSFDQQVNIIAIDFYSNDYEYYSSVIDRLLGKCNKLYVYISEPTLNNNNIDLAGFLKTNDNPKITFFSDAVLNFNLSHAKFYPVICWFIDHVNYYRTSRWGINLLSQLTHDYTKPLMFDCLLGQLKTHRNLVQELYNSSPIKNQIIFTYFKQNIRNGLWDLQYNPANIGNNLTGDLFHIDGEEARLSAMLPVDIYNQSYYSIVAETTASNEYNQYTEKVAKPILAKRPFVAFCGQHYLRNLRDLGFKTFSSVIDESYDSIPDMTSRFQLAWQQVEFLCSQDPMHIYNKLHQIMDHNYHHFQKTIWTSHLNQIGR